MRQLLRYKMAADGTGVVSPPGAVVRGLRVIMWKYWFSNLHGLQEIALCVTSNYSPVLLCASWLHLLLLADSVPSITGSRSPLCVALCVASSLTLGLHARR